MPALRLTRSPGGHEGQHPLIPRHGSSGRDRALVPHTQRSKGGGQQPLPCRHHWLIAAQPHAGLFFLTETPLHPHNDAQAHALHNHGYSLHHHPPHALSQPNVLAEARLPTHLKQPGGRCWLAYRRYSPRSSMARLFSLTSDSPRATTCAVERTLLIGAKTTIIVYYLPQPGEEQAQVCAALARLPTTLPNRLLIIGGGFQGGWEGTSQKYQHIKFSPYVRSTGPMNPTFTTCWQSKHTTCIDLLTIWDPVTWTDRGMTPNPPVRLPWPQRCSGSDLPPDPHLGGHSPLTR